ncbi:hypothetical protein [Mucilaginibacter gotjawali]|uniref:Archaellin n=2 Tax=Mucilaginibacter gotjawali TaxID=1550579 RepID=A0A839SNS5_9SPHI|nr:hypothetical protein [Mucilaginibacter gotjawali]MBB3058854.1 archaellin [Mucilaginibacter gotjawali]BAU52177.1 hypothetical protein MgSA37_00327 [Mucilaginibacter gotjawali]
MRVKIFKVSMLPVIAFLAINTAGFAQDISVSVSTSSPSEVSVNAKVKTKRIKAKINKLNNDLELSLDNLAANITETINDIAPKVVSEVTNMASNIVVEVNDDSNNDIAYNGDEKGSVIEKFKSYSKSYPLDGNDRIRLSNQYGKIVVNTWDRHEIKVDVQIKAVAQSDDEARKLLDGVQILDNKDGDQVSFKTQIERNNSSWKIWNWGGNNGKHKVEINYTVYMPAKTDLSVEDSYGSIQLPDLSGKVRINCSYGSVLAQNLSNPANEIEGSYGSLKAGNINGARLDYSYGSAEIEEINNLKADLSYGSFKLGKLNGTASIDLSYVGGFKIDEISNSFNKLNIDASYSSVALGVPANDNFNFDITTSYGGFSYDDEKVAITSKTPADGSRHESSTKNYKGHFGKGGSEAQINIHTSYGSVNFK